METLVLGEQKPLEVPRIQDVREAIDRVVCSPRDKIILKVTYLTAARASEVVSKVVPWEVAHHSTKPYGSLTSFTFENFKRTNGDVVKILLLKMGVGKHRIKLDDSTPNEQRVQKVVVRQVPIPCDLKFEPWTIDLLKWIREYKELRFAITRRTLHNIVKTNLRGLDPTIHAHSLRHYRITHLIRDYGFDPFQVSTFVGWSLRSAASNMGKAASPNLDIYAHLAWREYVEKMLVPLDKLG